MTTIIRRYGKVMHYTEIIMGVILIAIGILLFFGRFEQLASLGNFIESVDEVVVGRLLLYGFLAALGLGRQRPPVPSPAVCRAGPHSRLSGR